MKARWQPTERERNQLILDLIELKVFHGIWLKGKHLFAREQLWEDPILVHWDHCQALVTAARRDQVERKPPARAPGNARRARGGKRGA